MLLVAVGVEYAPVCNEMEGVVDDVIQDEDLSPAKGLRLKALLGSGRYEGQWTVEHVEAPGHEGEMVLGPSEVGVLTSYSTALPSKKAATWFIPRNSTSEAFKGAQTYTNPETSAPHSCQRS